MAKKSPVIWFGYVINGLFKYHLCFSSLHQYEQLRSDCVKSFLLVLVCINCSASLSKAPVANIKHLSEICT